MKIPILVLSIIVQINNNRLINKNTANFADNKKGFNNINNLLNSQRQRLCNAQIGNKRKNYGIYTNNEVKPKNTGICIFRLGYKFNILTALCASASIAALT